MATDIKVNSSSAWSQTSSSSRLQYSRACSSVRSIKKFINLLDLGFNKCCINVILFSGCTHFTWTPHSGGTCYLKKNQVNPNFAIFSENSICGFLSPTSKSASHDSRIDWLADKSAKSCDFSTATFHSETTLRENCLNLCYKFQQCTHFTWTTEQGKINHLRIL